MCCDISRVAPACYCERLPVPSLALARCCTCTGRLRRHIASLCTCTQADCDATLPLSCSLSLALSCSLLSLAYTPCTHQSALFLGALHQQQPRNPRVSDPARDCAGTADGAYTCIARTQLLRTAAGRFHYWWLSRQASRPSLYTMLRVRCCLFTLFNLQAANFLDA